MDGQWVVRVWMIDDSEIYQRDCSRPMSLDRILPPALTSMNPASNPPSFLLSAALWMKLHRCPNIQEPSVRNTPHSLVLYFEFSCWFFLSSCDPCANLHRFWQGQQPNSRNFLHSCDFSFSLPIAACPCPSPQCLGDEESSVEGEWLGCFWNGRSEWWAWGIWQCRRSMTLLVNIFLMIKLIKLFGLTRPPPPSTPAKSTPNHEIGSQKRGALCWGGLRWEGVMFCQDGYGMQRRVSSPDHRPAPPHLPYSSPARPFPLPSHPNLN